MRRSLVRSSGTALFVVLVALTAAGGTIAQAAELDEVATADSQTSPAGVPDSNAGKRNLNTVPEDGLDVGSTMGPNNGLVRKLMAARPNEDLIICGRRLFQRAGSCRLCAAYREADPQGRGG